MMSRRRTVHERDFSLYSGGNTGPLLIFLNGYRGSLDIPINLFKFNEWADANSGTVTLAALKAGGDRVIYTSGGTYTPAAGTRHIEVYYSSGSTTTINIDLDNMEVAGGEVIVMYYLSSPATTTLTIRDTANATIVSADTSGGTAKGGWVLAWMQYTPTAWNYVAMTQQ